MGSIQKSNIKTLVIGKSASLAVGGSGATSLDYSDQDLGPGEIMLISALVIPTTPGVVEVDISKNSIGVDGASAFAAVLAETKIQKLVIGPQSTVIPVHDTEVTKLDVSNQNLGPAEIMLISSATLTTPGLVEVVISDNKCFGSKPGKYSYSAHVHDIDKDQTGWDALCEAMKGS